MPKKKRMGGFSYRKGITSKVTTEIVSADTSLSDDDIPLNLRFAKWKDYTTPKKKCYGGFSLRKEITSKVKTEIVSVDTSSSDDDMPLNLRLVKKRTGVVSSLEHSIVPVTVRLQKIKSEQFTWPISSAADNSPQVTSTSDSSVNGTGDTQSPRNLNFSLPLVKSEPSTSNVTENSNDPQMIIINLNNMEPDKVKSLEFKIFFNGHSENFNPN